MKGIFQTALAATLSTIVAGHAIWVEFDVNGVSQGKFNGLRLPTYDGPIENVNSAYMACNGEGQNVLTKISPNVISVAAGSSITIHYAHTLDTDWKTGMIIDGSHKGPLLAYMAKVNDALGPAPTSGWFKIAEKGFNGRTSAVDDLIATKGWTFTIPPCVQNGDYLLRVELIALHSAGNYPGAQFYMECAQIRVTGGSGTLSPATVSFPGAYSGSDPGVKFNLYSSNINYVIPGPKVQTCGGSSNPQPTTTPPAAGTTSAVRTTTRSTTTTSATRTTVPAVTTTSAAAAGAQTPWGQCGGRDWKGPTTCASGTCKVMNDYYSQCQS